MAKIGYARVSTEDQNPAGQTARLKADGCVRVYVDHGESGAKASRPEWDKCLDRLERGDVLVACKLDRFSRSLHHLSLLGMDFRERGIELRCLDQPIDTTTPEGRLFFHILGAFAEYERDLISTRTKEGLDTVELRGRSGGRLPTFSPEQATAIRAMRETRNAGGKRVYTIEEIQAAFPVNGKPAARTTIYRTLKMTSDSGDPEEAARRAERYATLRAERIRQKREREAVNATGIKYDCATCGAKPGKPCHTLESGEPTTIHEDRYNKLVLALSKEQAS